MPLICVLTTLLLLQISYYRCEYVYNIVNFGCCLCIIHLIHSCVCNYYSFACHSGKLCPIRDVTILSLKMYICFHKSAMNCKSNCTCKGLYFYPNKLHLSILLSFSSNIFQLIYYTLVILTLISMLLIVYIISMFYRCLYIYHSTYHDLFSGDLINTCSNILHLINFFDEQIVRLYYSITIEIDQELFQNTCWISNICIDVHYNLNSTTTKKIKKFFHY